MRYVGLSLLVLGGHWASGAAAEVHAEAGYWVRCQSPQVQLTFEFDLERELVRNVDYNVELKVAYWSDEAINSEFPYEMSISSIVPNAPESKFVGLNFDRLGGRLLLGGTIPPTAAEVAVCEEERGWGCRDHFVVGSTQLECKRIEQKF
jgi:hypothetical protein